MDRLIDTLRTVMAGYAGKGFNGTSYLTESADSTTFAVVSVALMPDRRVADAGLIVRVVDDQIIIEQDMNDKTLVEALLQAHVPREKIVLAYAGEATTALPT